MVGRVQSGMEVINIKDLTLVTRYGEKGGACEKIVSNEMRRLKNICCTVW